MRDNAGWWLVIGGSLIVVGSFMPWVTASTIFGTIGRSGMDGDGVITVVAGAIVALLGGMIVSGNRISGLTRVLLWLGLVVSVLVWVVDFMDIRDRLDSVNSEYAAGSIGYGMWVLVAGIVVGVIGAVNLPSSPEAADETAA